MGPVLLPVSSSVIICGLRLLDDCITAVGVASAVAVVGLTIVAAVALVVIMVVVVVSGVALVAKEDD